METLMGPNATAHCYATFWLSGLKLLLILYKSTVFAVCKFILKIIFNTMIIWTSFILPLYALFGFHYIAVLHWISSLFTLKFQCTLVQCISFFTLKQSFFMFMELPYMFHLDAVDSSESLDWFMAILYLDL